MAPASDRCVGVVGLGMMGQPISRRLAKAGKRIALFDIDRDKAVEVAERTGGEVADSLAELGAACDIVITILPNSGNVEEALFGSDGLARGLRPGSLVVEMSSGQPKRTIDFGRRLNEIGIGTLDAPVSGGVARAQTGELAIMVGGREADFEKVKDVLECLGTTIVRTGPLGTGQAMKALNNLVSAGGFLIAAEALQVGREFGLDPVTIIDVLNASSGMNNSTKNKFKQHVLSETFASGFALDLMVKDLGIALELAEHMQIEAPFARLCRERWAAGAQALGRGKDHTALAKFVADAAHSVAGISEGPGASVDAQAKGDIETECRNLVIRMVHASDHGQAEVVADLFAPEGRWLRGGKLLEGRDAICASFAGRDDYTVRHVVAATLVEVEAADRAKGVSYYVAYRGKGEPTGGVPLPLEPPFSMGEWHDRYVRTKSGWRFDYREVRRLFQRP